MPPCLDIYVRLPKRSRRVFEQFLNGRVRDALSAEAWAAEGSTANLIDQPLDGVGSSTTLYSRRSHTIGEIYRAIVAFGTDGSMVLGVSLDDEQDDPGVTARAITMLDELLEQFEGTEGAVVWEQPPPLNASEWAVLDDLGGLTVTHRRRSC